MPTAAALEIGYSDRVIESLQTVFVSRQRFWLGQFPLTFDWVARNSMT